MKLSLSLVMLLICSSLSYSQELHLDHIKLQEMKTAKLEIAELSKQSSASISGIFISPHIGISFPISEFRDNSRAAFFYGAKVEYASTSIFPFVIGGFFQSQKHLGSEDFKAENRINVLETTLTQFGGSVDILLSRILPTYFTLPLATLEVSQISINRVITPAANNPGLQESDSKIGLTAGLGFTLFIFDILGKYTYAGEYSSFNVSTRFHFPLIKF